MPLLLWCEWLALAYAAALCLASIVAPGPRRVPACLASAACATLVLAMATLAPMEWRLLAPHVYLLAGYWTPALLVRADAAGGSPRRFEAWLIRSDAVLRPWLPAIPRGLRAMTELAYLFCYPLVPLSCALAWWRATPDELDRFWLAVLSAGYACYVTLPWLPTRPPRAVQAPPPEPSGLRSLNALVLGRFSHHWNTFPSGHVAVAGAAAAGVWQVWPAAGVLVGVLAAAVGVGAAAGRYHYVVDVVAGALVAALFAMITW